MPAFLIVSENALEYADEIVRIADPPVTFKSSTTAEQALSQYTNETVLFGNPAMIAEILPDLPSVDWVQSTWAGVLPLLAITRRDYRLTNMKDVFGPQMSEYVMGFLLAHELRLSERRNAQHRHEWFTARSGHIAGKRFGIMGTGSIGQHLAGTAQHFGATVSGLSRSGASAPGFDHVLPVNELSQFLANLDYLVSTLPQTAATDKLLNAETLAKLPEHAYFINVGRGNVVDEQALMDSLNRGTLAGAALDVFNDEPVAPDSPLWDTPNLSITAHIAAVSHAALMVPVFLDNYRRYVNAQPLRHMVDFAAGY